MRRPRAGSAYAEYDAESERFFLTPEQAVCLADPDSPTFLPGAFYMAASCVRDEPKITERFRTGEGLGWHEHDGDLFCGTELFFRPGYVANLVPSWLPALEGVEEKLLAGARVADIGCGHGASTIVMAKAYPRSEFVGFDYHGESVAAARRAAQRARVGDRVRFEVASAKDFPGEGYDLVCVFDALHDMGDPVGAAAHVLGALAQDGSWLIVEPMAGDRTEENLNPVGRIFYSASTLICTPASRSQEVGRVRRVPLLLHAPRIWMESGNARCHASPLSPARGGERPSLVNRDAALRVRTRRGRRPRYSRAAPAPSGVPTRTLLPAILLAWRIP